MFDDTNVRPMKNKLKFASLPNLIPKSLNKKYKTKTH